jgi:hypothetical protein
MCNDEDIAKRCFLIFTNLIMFFPLYRIINESYRVAKRSYSFDHDTCCRKFLKVIWTFITKFIIEFVVYATTMIVSMLYHACDNLDKCTKICVAEWKTLYHLDFIFSYLTLCTLIVALVDRNTSIFKIIVNGLYVIGISIYITQYKDSDIDGRAGNIFYGAIAISSSLIITGKIIYLACKDKLSHEYIYHFDWLDFVFGFFCLVLGIVFKVIDSNEDYYYLFHSLWHVFIMLAIMFCIELYDKSVTVLCCKRNSPPCECDD